MKRLLCVALAGTVLLGGFGVTSAAAAGPGAVVGIATTPSGAGHWLVAADGQLSTDGDATSHGSLAGQSLNQPIVGIAATPSGQGYWFVARDGGIFSFGDAAFYGSTGALTLNQPIVGMAASPTGHGYWLVATDGGIFSFGDAHFYGSTGALTLNQPIVGMAASPTGHGYWLAAADGGIFTFGDAPFNGTGNRGTTAVAGGGGYALASIDGVVSAHPLAGSAPAPAPSPSPSPAPASRVAALWPFASDSPWNMPIGSNATYESASATRTANLIDPSIVAWANVEQYSHPIYQASVTDPLAVFSRAGFATVRVAVPAGATPAAGTDRHLHVIDPTGHYVDENWDVQGSFPNFTTGYHVRTDLYGPGVGQGGVRAYGGSAIGGLIRTWELQQGAIHHALALALTGGQLARGPVWPATAQDGNAATTYSGSVPMGSLAAIPPSVDVTTLGLTPTGVAVARALQDYGAYVVDRSGCVCLYAEPTSAGTQQAGDLRHDVATLRSLLRIVTDNGPAAVGGGGTPRVALAPPLG